MSEFGAMSALKAYKDAVARGMTSDDAVAVALTRLRFIDPGASEVELRYWLSHRLAAERLEERRRKGRPEPEPET
jgi:hypothetical protein